MGTKAHADAFTFYRDLARATLGDGSRLLRCVAMQAWLEEAEGRLKDGTADKSTEKKIDRLWVTYQPRPVAFGASVRRLAQIVEVASLAREQLGLDASRVLFAQLVYEGLPAVYVLNLSGGVKALADEATAVWRRGAGSPATTDKRRPKWTVFADLHEAIGLGAIDPDDVKKECSPSRRRKGRKARP